MVVRLNLSFGGRVEARHKGERRVEARLASSLAFDATSTGWNCGCLRFNRLVPFYSQVDSTNVTMASHRTLIIYILNLLTDDGLNEARNLVVPVQENDTTTSIWRQNSLSTFDSPSGSIISAGH